MSKYNSPDLKVKAGRSPLVTTDTTLPSGKTHEGGPGFARDAKSNLFLRATSAFAGEDSFYEDAFVRDDAVRTLTRQIAVTPDGMAWLSGFLGWLRTEGNMRTAPVLMAAEAVQARLSHNPPLSGGNRQLISSVLDRADEPGEMLAYWMTRFGRKIPIAVKRGVADAAIRLWNEYALLKYDTESHALRFGDILELTHAGDSRGSRQNLQGSWQHDLFKYAIDRRHGRDGEIPASLPMVASRKALNRTAADSADELLDADEVRAAGMTWQNALSLAGGKADKAKVWEAQIPTMGYMALLRNLRNFDEAGISAGAVKAVQKRLSDPQQVAKSRQFPFRFLSAYLNVKSVRWHQALEEALGYATQNIPELPGRTLILIDTSASMRDPMSAPPKKKGDKRPEPKRPTRVRAAAVFALALAMKNAGRVDVCGFADGQFRVDGIDPGAAVLRAVELFDQSIGRVGHGTQIEVAVRATYGKHDRVIIFTDMQTFPSSNRLYGYHIGDAAQAVPPSVPIYGFNLSSYDMSALSGASNRHELGGLTDATFKMIPLIEAGAAAKWPWEDAA